MKKAWLLLSLIVLVGCTSTTERGAPPSRNGVTTGQGSRVEVGPDVNIGPNPQESSPSIRERNLQRPEVNQPFANDPATIQPSR